MKFDELKSKVIGFFRTDWQIKLVSFLLSFVIWFLICEYVDPDTDARVSNIPITAQYEGSVPEKEGLGIMTAIDETVSIRVSGSRDTIALMDYDKITATVDLNNVTKSGEYDLPVKINLGNQSLKVESQSIETVKVRFDMNKLKNIPLDIQVSGDVAEGFIREEPKLVNGFVTVNGPAAIVDTIVSAKVTISQTEFRETVTFEKCEYVFVDENDKEVAKTFLNIQEDMKTITVEIPVVKQKTVPFTVGIINSSGGKDSGFCTVKIEPEDIVISGNSEVLDAINGINLGDIDVAEKKENFEASAKVLLPDGVKNVNNIESVKVSVTFNDDVQSRAFRVSNIEIVNLPDGTKASIQESTMQITIRGTAEDMAKLKNSDLKLVVDAKNQVLNSGTYRLSATVHFPENAEYKVGVVGKYQVTVIVS